MQGNWLHLDETENAIDFLEATARFLETIPDETKWKWVSISLYGALYGFAICAVQGTCPNRVTYKKKGKSKLISVPEALKRCQSQRWMGQYTNSNVLTLSDDEKWAIENLRATLRNNFAHFKPTSWSLEITPMPDIISHVLRVIEFLALESGNTMLDDEQINRIKHAARRIRTTVESERARLRQSEKD